MQDHWNLNCLKKLDYIFEEELPPPQSDFNIIGPSGDLWLRSPVCSTASCASPLPITGTSNYTRMETTGLVMRTQFGLNKSSVALSQSSYLAWAGWASLQHPAAGSPVL